MTNKQLKKFAQKTLELSLGFTPKLTQITLLEANYAYEGTVQRLDFQVNGSHLYYRVELKYNRYDVLVYIQENEHHTIEACLKRNFTIT